MAAIRHGRQAHATRHLRITADRDRLLVERRAVSTSAGWTEHLAVAWPQVHALVFDTQGLDPVVSLFALMDGGQRRYVADANHLSRPRWSTFATAVADCTDGRVTINLDRRDDPRAYATADPGARTRRRRGR